MAFSTSGRAAWLDRLLHGLSLSALSIKLSGTTNAWDCSLLLPGCTPRVHREIARWAAAATARAKQALSGSQLRAHVRAFRWSSRDILELSLQDELGHSHAISFTAGFGRNLDAVEPDVRDLVEALHMAGIVIRLLGASVTVGDRDAFEREIEAA